MNLMLTEHQWLLSDAFKSFVVPGNFVKVFLEIAFDAVVD